jgi:hypothetical protein
MVAIEPQSNLPINVNEFLPIQTPANVNLPENINQETALEMLRQMTLSMNSFKIIIGGSRVAN